MTTPRSVGSLLLATLFLYGCASVDIQEYRADETTKQGGPGLPYYMPRPYIVAVLLPPDPSGSSGTTDTVPTAKPQPGGNAPVMPVNPPGHDPTPPPNVIAHKGKAGAAPRAAAPAKPAPPAAPGQATGSTTDGGQPAKTTAPAVGATETQDGGLQFSNSRYLFRIIQLQDYSRPVRINVHPGLFGTASISPQLTGGWRLNGLSASADQTAFATLLGSVFSTAATLANGAASGAGGGAKAALAGGGPPPEPEGLGAGVLEPGLYKILFHKVSGEPAGLCKVALFGPTPPNGGAPPPADIGCADPE